MGVDQILTADELAPKLRNLKELMPGEPEVVYVFGEYLSRWISFQCNAVGFDFSARRAISDAQEGMRKEDCGPIPEGLKGAYDLLEAAIPRIAKAVCPHDFAEKVRVTYEKVHQGIDVLGIWTT